MSEVTVVIGVTPLEPDQVAQLRYAIEDRMSTLAVISGKCARAHVDSGGVDKDADTCLELLALLDPAAQERERVKRSQIAVFDSGTAV